MAWGKIYPLKPQKKPKLNKEEFNTKMKRLNHYLSILILSINGLNSSIKRHILADWIKKQEPSIFLQATLSLQR